MERIRHIRKSLARSLPLFAGICLCLYFSYHTYYGERSQSRLNELSASMEEKAVELDALKVQRAALEEKVSLLRPHTLSKDMVDQQARFMLGFTESGEKVVIDN